MSSQQPNSEEELKKAEQSLSTVKSRIQDCAKTLESIVNALNFQLLGNIDTLSDAGNLCNGNGEIDQEKVKLLSENLIKKPFRRQVGRLKGVKRILEELNNQA